MIEVMKEEYITALSKRML